MIRRPFLVLAPFAAAVLAGCAAGPSTDFSNLAGAWSGVQMRDTGDPRPMDVTILPDGSYTWASNGVTVTDGQLSLEDGGLVYANDAGSRGTVVAGEDELQFTNTFTGDSYRLTVAR